MRFEEVKTRLTNLDAACLCDADKSLRVNLRVVDPIIRPIRLGLKMVGRAHTVTCYEDFLTVIKGLRDAQPGEVLVIDAQGGRKAVAGELFPSEALRKGLAGIIVDGACRDTETVRSLDLPYYARSVCCYPGTTLRLFDTQVPVSCGGVVVHPGDVIFGDDDGLVVGSVEQFAEVIPVAEAIQAKEERILAEMKSGTSLLDMVNFDEHCAKLAAGEPSQLSFLV